MKMKLKLLPVSIAAVLLVTPLVSIAETNEVVDEGVVFSGYARYGMLYSSEAADTVSAEGQLAGNATGRLGNEGNGGEFQFSKKIVNDNGSVWDVILMMENWGGSASSDTVDVTGGGDVSLKKFYAGGKNVFESQPNAYVWAGRDFHQRPQQSLNDYFWMTHDGQGAGIYNIELSYFSKLDFAVVGQTDGTGDSGNYAFTSKLHGIGLSDSLNFSFLFNYGFTSDEDSELSAASVATTDDAASSAEASTAYQVASVLNQIWSMGSNQFIVRYAMGADNSVYSRSEDLTTLYVSLEGNIKFNESVSLEYLGAYHSYVNDSIASDDRTNYSVIARTLYNWSSVHSTWLEAGYSIVDFDNQDATNSAWKVTLSQNIAINAFDNARPMLRLYATVGEADNEAYLTTTTASTEDTLAVGAMFEAWW